MSQTIDKQPIKLIRTEAESQSLFDKWLWERLSHADYMALTSHLNASQHRLTRLKREPVIIETQEVEIIAQLTNTTMQEVWNEIKKSTK